MKKNVRNALLGAFGVWLLIGLVSVIGNSFGFHAMAAVICAVFFTLALFAAFGGFDD